MKSKFRIYSSFFKLHSSFLLLHSYFLLLHFTFYILLFTFYLLPVFFSLPVQSGVPEVEHDVRQDYKKIDEIEDRREVIGMRDDLAGDAEHIADLDQAQKRQAFPFGGARADRLHNVSRP